jgi:hypothetical protein
MRLCNTGRIRREILVTNFASSQLIFLFLLVAVLCADRPAMSSLWWPTVTGIDSCNYLINILSLCKYFIEDWPMMHRTILYIHLL